MDAENFSDKKRFDSNYEIKFFRRLGLKPIFNCSNPERFYTYYLILSDIYDFEMVDKIIELKYNLLITKKNIDHALRDIVINDTTTVLNNYTETIIHYQQEDLTGMFFI